MRPIEQQVIMVTGATDGLGRAIAGELAGRGATLLIHGRSDERGKQVMAEIRAKHPNARVSFHRADLSRLSEVRDLASEVKKHLAREAGKGAGPLSGTPRLDVLVNNAGVYLEERKVTADGNEMAFQVNYLSHVLLTRLLLPLLTAAAGARIVNVASAGQSAIDFDDVMLERSYSGSVSYQQSKLAQIMFTFDLSEQLRDGGVSVNALHPATFMPTKMVVGRFPPSHTIEDGMRATVNLIASPKLDGVTGKYFNMMREARAHAQAYDAAARRRLRELTDRLIGN